MIQKICIFLFIAVLFFSCGKKGDPIYNEENQNSGIVSNEKSII